MELKDKVSKGGDQLLESKEVKDGRKQFKRSRGKRNFRRSKDEKPGNDFSYWNEYPELMGLATRFPWMHIAGTPLKGTGINVSLPNVAVQSFLPIPGVQDSATSPLNLAFRAMYLDMHRKYRGIGTYQASDIAITMLCIESVLQKLVEAERVYGIANAYPVKSRIQPEGLLRALGYSAAFINSVNANRADFRYGINRLINLAQRLPLPSGMSFFANHVGLNGFIYKDSNDERADLIAFACQGFFEYRTTTAAFCINNAGTAQLVPFTRSGFISYNDLLNNIESSLTTLLYDSDILRITSDFIACYGESNMQSLMPLEEGYVVVPQYNEAILRKWHNSERHVTINSSMYLTYGCASPSTTHVSLSSPGVNFAVYQEGDVVFSLPIKSASSGTREWNQESGSNRVYYCSGTQIDNSNMKGTHIAHLVDTWEETPSEETACESVLWKADVTLYTGTGSGGGSVYCDKITNFGTELLTDLTIYSVANSSLAGTMPTYMTYYITSSWNAGLFTALAQFDWHPYNFTAVNTSSDINGVLGDTDNVSIVTSDTISKIVDAALLSAFKIKVSGSKSSE